MLFLVCLGFFLMPNHSYAYSKESTKIEQKECSSIKTKKSPEKDCCRTKSCSKNKQNNGCKGNCNNNSCRCSVPFSALGLLVQVEIGSKNYLAETKKLKFSFKQAYISSGFHFAWLPPKIS